MANKPDDAVEAAAIEYRCPVGRAGAIHRQMLEIAKIDPTKITIVEYGPELPKLPKEWKGPFYVDHEPDTPFLRWAVVNDDGQVLSRWFTVESHANFLRDLLNAVDAQQMEVRDRPEVVCLCGSTRFADQHAIKRWELEKDGKAICVMINYLPAWYADEQGWDGHNHFGESAGNKDILDELHLRKIDLADRVLILNVGGYIGESTADEIAYAEKTGKPIDYLEPFNAQQKGGE